MMEILAVVVLEKERTSTILKVLLRISAYKIHKIIIVILYYLQVQSMES